jgi:hypothetical protein
MRFRRRADGHDARAREPDGLIDGCAIIDEVARLHDDFVAQPGGVRQTFDQTEVVACHGGGNAQRNGCRTGRRDITAFAAARLRDRGRGLALQIVDLDELRQDLRDAVDHRCADAGRAQARHRA